MLPFIHIWYVNKYPTKIPTLISMGKMVYFPLFFFLFINENCNNLHSTVLLLLSKYALELNFYLDNRRF